MMDCDVLIVGGGIAGMESGLTLGDMGYRVALVEKEPSVGGVLEVLSSDAGTNEDIPLWAKKVGHEFLGSLEEAGYWRLYVKRGK